MSTGGHAKHMATGDSQLLFTFEEAARLANVSRSMIRKLARTGRLDVVHVGRCVRIPRRAVLGLCGALDSVEQIALATSPGRTRYSREEK